MKSCYLSTEISKLSINQMSQLFTYQFLDGCRVTFYVYYLQLSIFYNYYYGNILRYALESFKRIKQGDSEGFIF